LGQRITKEREQRKESARYVDRGGKKSGGFGEAKKKTSRVFKEKQQRSS